MDGLKIFKQKKLTFVLNYIIIFCVINKTYYNNKQMTKKSSNSFIPNDYIFSKYKCGMNENCGQKKRNEKKNCHVHYISTTVIDKCIICVNIWKWDNWKLVDNDNNNVKSLYCFCFIEQSK